MIVEGTTEAELVSAAASHRWDDAAKVPSLDAAVDRIHAFGGRAPP